MFLSYKAIVCWYNQRRCDDNPVVSLLDYISLEPQAISSKADFRLAASGGQYAVASSGEERHLNNIPHPIPLPMIQVAASRN